MRDIADGVNGAGGQSERTDSEQPIADWLHARWSSDLERFSVETSMLLAEEAAWIHRRVETIEFLDGSRIRRRMSVDFTIPDLGAVHRRWEGPTTVLPMALPRKRPMKAFDAIDEEGRVLAVLTRDQNSEIAACVLADQAEAVLLDEGIPLPDELRVDFQDIAGCRRRADDKPTEAQRLERCGSALNAFSTVATPVTDASKFSGADFARFVLWKDEVFNGLLREFGERYLLFVVLPDSAAGERRVVKFTYEEETEPNHRAGRVRLLLESLGLRRLGARISTRALFGASSYHIEVQAPDEVLIKRAELAVLETVINRAEPLKSPNRKVERIRALVREAEIERTHLFDAGVERNTNGARDPLLATVSELGYVQLELALKPASILAPAMMCLLTAAVLLGGVIAHMLGYSAPAEPSVALLVIIPAIFAAYLLPGEHRLLRKVYRALRISVFVATAGAFAAAAAFDLDMSTHATFRIWLIIGILTLLIGVLLASAAILAKRRSSAKWVKQAPETSDNRYAVFP